MILAVIPARPAFYHVEQECAYVLCVVCITKPTLDYANMNLVSHHNFWALLILLFMKVVFFSEKTVCHEKHGEGVKQIETKKNTLTPFRRRARV